MNETTVTVTGWVGGEVSLRQAGEHPVANFRLASQPSRWRDGEWHRGPTTWHHVKAWNQLAENAAASIASGDPVVVHGRLVAEQWQREDGSRATRFVLVASALGHNLALGSARFERTPAGAGRPAQPAAATTAPSTEAGVGAAPTTDGEDAADAA